jgi:hypothetical protein
MRRVALIISDEGSHWNQSHLPGVRSDIQTVTNFLKNPITGAWTSKGIFYLNKPTLKKLHDALLVLESYDVAFVYFTGHGFRKNNSDFIEAGNNNIAINTLTRTYKKRFVFIDACRNIVIDDRRPVEPFIGDPGLPMLDFAAGRRAWVRRMNELPNGVALVQSCSAGQSSIDTPDGGLFTKNFFDSLIFRAFTNEVRILNKGTQEAKWQFGNTRQDAQIAFSKSWALKEVPLVVTANQINRELKLMAYEKQIDNTQRNRFLGY